MRLLRFVLVAVLLSLGVAHAQSIDYAEDYVAPDARPFRTPTVHGSLGQSWAGLYWAGMLSHGFNSLPGILLQFGGKTSFPTGILPVSSGIFLSPNADGTPAFSGLVSIEEPEDAWPVAALTTDTGDAITVGRASVLAQNWLRFANGKPLTPILEFNDSCPSSSLVSGPCGGLGPQTATFSWTISGAPDAPVLTLSGMAGTVTSGQIVIGAPLQTKIGTAISATCDSALLCGNGTFNVSNASSVGVVNGSGTGSAESYPWWVLRQLLAQIANVFPNAAARLNTPIVTGYTLLQGGSFNTSDAAATVTEWTVWHTALDALQPNGPGGLVPWIYWGIRAPNSADTVASQAIEGAYQFLRAAAANPSSSVIPGCPWYQYPFIGTDGIHLSDDGVIEMGQCMGYLEYLMEDEGVVGKPTPLWDSVDLPVVVSGTTITVPFDRPKGAAFANAPLEWFHDDLEGLIDWPQQGWHVIRGVTELPLCNGTPTIVALTVRLDICTAPLPGDKWSYAFHGPGGPAVNTRTGVGGNLMMQGPPSHLYPGRSIKFWAYPVEKSLP